MTSGDSGLTDLQHSATPRFRAGDHCRIQASIHDSVVVTGACQNSLFARILERRHMSLKPDVPSSY